MKINYSSYYAAPLGYPIQLPTKIKLKVKERKVEELTNTSGLENRTKKDFLDLFI